MRPEDYIDIVGEEAIAEIHRAAQPLSDKRVLHVNATYFGGGVAEMLHTILPLMNAVGLDADWSLLYGHPDLFHMTKKLHNGLQGEAVDISQPELATYLSVNEAFARYTPIMHDAVIIHDPQPLPTIHFRRSSHPWIWRCHIDPSAPSEDVWDLLKPYISEYDAMVVSAESFRKPDLPVKTYIIPPAIDPFSTINRDMSADEVNAKLAEYDIPQDKPLIVQVSRFDKWKDPAGVLNVFERVRKELDCRLVMLGNMAGDDPEGPVIYGQVAAKAAQMTDVHLITETDPALVNALQRSAAVVLQLSLKEGFGLTVSEALWKGTPVIATRVGGIPLQIEDGKMGYLTAAKDYETMSERVLAILASGDLGAAMGAAGREHVREKFLMTRLLLDWLKLLNEVVQD
jgi:trehalose synthase